MTPDFHETEFGLFFRFELNIRLTYTFLPTIKHSKTEEC